MTKTTNLLRQNHDSPIIQEMYRSEKALVDKFVSQLRSTESPWGSVSIRREFRYEGGLTDVIALQENGHLLAFEAKLVKWREALVQAYRASFFANRSYVLLPEATARVAEGCIAEFRARRVGLCSIQGEKIRIVLDAEVADPMQTWVYGAAFQMIGGRFGPRSATGASGESVLRSKQS